MTDTSPAAIKAWALSKAADIDNLPSEIRTWLGNDAGDEYEKDGKADDAPDAAMFRAVAALADLADGGGWRTMDSALRDRKGHFLAGHPEHGVTECWCVRDTEHPWGVALMTPDGPLPDRANARWRWRPLPAPPT